MQNRREVSWDKHILLVMKLCITAVISVVMCVVASVFKPCSYHEFILKDTDQIGPFEKAFPCRVITACSWQGSCTPVQMRTGLALRGMCSGIVESSQEKRGMPACLVLDKWAGQRRVGKSCLLPRGLKSFPIIFVILER